MLYIDSDNAMGSFMGDIDDGFALTALLASSLEINAVGSVAGNSSEIAAYRNNQKLISFFRNPPPLLRGSQEGAGQENSSALFLSQVAYPYRIAALGPLTNIAKALELGLKKNPDELLIVGGSLNSKGIFPPIWPKEFNLTQDKESAHTVFNSSLPITLLPLEVAKRFQISLAQIREISGPIGNYLYQYSKRWFVRARLIKFSSTVPLWDLAGSLYFVAPQHFRTQTLKMAFHPRGFLKPNPLGRELKAIIDFDQAKLWQIYVNLIKKQME